MGKFLQYYIEIDPVVSDKKFFYKVFFFFFLLVASLYGFKIFEPFSVSITWGSIL